MRRLRWTIFRRLIPSARRLRTSSASGKRAWAGVSAFLGPSRPRSGARSWTPHRRSASGLRSRHATLLKPAQFTADLPALVLPDEKAFQPLRRQVLHDALRVAALGGYGQCLRRCPAKICTFGPRFPLTRVLRAGSRWNKPLLPLHSPSRRLEPDRLGPFGASIGCALLRLASHRNHLKILRIDLGGPVGSPIVTRPQIGQFTPKLLLRCFPGR